MFPWSVGGGDLMCCDVMWYDVMWLVAVCDDVMWLVVRWPGVR